MQGIFENIVRYITDLGASTMLPIVIFILCICFRISVGKALKSGLMIGVGFVGIDLIIGMMNERLGAAARLMSERFGLHLQVIDIGWQGAAPLSWGSALAVPAVVIAILVNLVMLGLKLTKTVNVDIWNIWHMIFTGACAWAATGNFWIGITGVAVHAAVSYKLGDLWAPYIEDYFELEGLTVPHGTTAYMAPVSCAVDWIIEKIPAIGKLDFPMETLQEKVGILAEPVVIGAVLGTAIGLLAGYGADEALPLGISMAAVMVLMPKIVKCIMEGLMPLAERAKELLGEHFGNEGVYIGLDPSILLGDPQVITAGLLFIPATLIIAMVMPGNRILPFGDLATISFFIALSVGIHKGNMFRTLVSGSVIMAATIWIANQTIPWISGMAGENAGSKIAALDQGGSPITYIFTELCTRENIPGFVVITVIYLGCIFITVKGKKE